MNSASALSTQRPPPLDLTVHHMLRASEALGEKRLPGIDRAGNCHFRIDRHRVNIKNIEDATSRAARGHVSLFHNALKAEAESGTGLYGIAKVA